MLTIIHSLAVASLFLTPLYQASAILSRTLSSEQILLGDTHSSVPFTFRDATYEDIDDATTIIIDAFSPSPQWHYHSPSREKYLDYEWYCMREAIEKQWKEVDWTYAWGRVVSVPVENSKHGRDERVVALALWDRLIQDSASVVASGEDGALNVNHGFDLMALLNKTFDCSKHSDLNMTRGLDFSYQFSFAKYKYIDNAYDDQLYLSLLATHPDWDGNGLGAKNLHWGMELAERWKVPVTLIATPAGYPLYRSEGFEDVKNITIKMLDGLGELWFEVQRWNST